MWIAARLKQHRSWVLERIVRLAVLDMCLDGQKSMLSIRVWG